MRRELSLIGAVALVGLASCSPINQADTGGGGGNDGTTATKTDSGTGAGGAGVGGEGGDLFEIGGGPAGGAGGGVQDCNSGPNDDFDMDGYTFSQGDCNDCDANVNPKAIEVMTDTGEGGSGPGVPVDEDCDDLIDDADPDLLPCDAGLLVDGGPYDAIKAIDLCKVATNADEWGVLEAKWIMADGSPPAGGNFDLGHGILAGFGPNVNVQKGDRMLAVSSGAARQPSDPGYQSPGGFSKGYSCNHPFGFPKESPSCGVAVTGGCYDSTGLEVKIRVPSNAQGFSFNFNFFTFEWPGYVCSTFNDFFTTILSPYPAGQSDGNIVFDNLGNPVSVNNAFVDVCGCFGGPPCFAGGKTFDCTLGTAGLQGNGFGTDLAGSDHGSTYWLSTQAPVTPGSEITLQFVAYDSGDGILDSTGLVDNFTWIAEPGTKIETKPIPDPQ